MIGACILTLDSDEYKPIWTAHAPPAFASDFANLRSGYAAVLAKGAEADGASRSTGGATDAKAAAATQLEESAFVTARALASHFRTTNDLLRLGKVNLTRTQINRMRSQELINRSTAIRDLAGIVVSEANAADRGITTERITSLSSAITDFSQLMNSPRVEMVNRGALLKELETDIAELMKTVENLDDLVLQFSSSEETTRFKEAWKRARIIVDNGTSHTNGAPPDPAPAAPTTPDPAPTTPTPNPAPMP
jgi:hypothetical protein